MTPTPTPTVPPEPVITFFGLLNADGTSDSGNPVAFSPEGIPIYERPLGFGFIIVVEARKGGDGASVGLSTFDYVPGDPSVRPDLQILSSQPLGDGSLAVCDNTLPEFGGVPAVPGENFAETEFITAAINDFGCRFVDGQGNPRGRTADGACFRRPDGDFGFVISTSQVQFCATVPRLMAFPRGDTLLTVRVRNVNGRTSRPARLIVRSRS